MADDEGERRRERLERDQAARRLFQTAPYRAVVEDMTELVVRWLPDGTRLFVNDAYCRLYDTPRAELVGTSFWPLISEEDREEVRRRLAMLTPESPVVTGRHRSVRPDGTAFWMEWTDRALFDSTSRVVELQSVGRDITESIRVEEELRRIEQADAIARHSAAIAHDLGGVFQIIATEIELARLARPGELEHAHTAVTQGIALLQQLRASAQGRVLRPVPVDLGARVEAALGLLREVAGRRARVETVRSTAPATIAGDPTQIDQVLLNLVRNAAEAMPDGGRIVVATETLPRAALSGEHRFVGERPERVSVLRVSDEGPGIPASIRDRIFDPHVTTKENGQGLGLATVRSVVIAHRGSIVVDGASRGTTFELAFPFA